MNEWTVKLIHGLHSCLQVLDFSENLTTFSTFRLHSFSERLSFEFRDFKNCRSTIECYIVFLVPVASCNKEEEQLAQQSVSIIEVLNIVSNFLNVGFLASL